MRPAFGGRDRVAIGVAEAVILVLGPHRRPFDAAAPGAAPGTAIRKFGLAQKRARRQQVALGKARREEIAKPAWEMQPRLLGHALGPRQRGIAAPADLDAAEQIGLGPRHAVEQRRTERRIAENLGIGVETERRAAAVLNRSAILDRFPFGHAAAVALPPQPSIARHLDFERIGEGVDDRDADAVQPARGLVRLAAEFAARVQHRQDHLERRFLGETGMRIDRNAAAVIAHGDPTVAVEFQFDAARKPGDCLVHCIVEHFGGEMVQRALVGAADIHAGPSPDRLQSFEDLDVLGGIAVGGIVGARSGRGRREAVEEICHAPIIGRLAPGASRMQYTDHGRVNN